MSSIARRSSVAALSSAAVPRRLAAISRVSSGRGSSRRTALHMRLTPSRYWSRSTTRFLRQPALLVVFLAAAARHPGFLKGAVDVAGIAAAALGNLRPA